MFRRTPVFFSIFPGKDCGEGCERREVEGEIIWTQSGSEGYIFFISESAGGGSKSFQEEEAADEAAELRELQRVHRTPVSAASRGIKWHRLPPELSSGPSPATSYRGAGLDC